VPTTTTDPTPPTAAPILAAEALAEIEARKPVAWHVPEGEEIYHPFERLALPLSNGGKAAMNSANVFQHLADHDALIASHRALSAEVARLADAERRLLPQTADGYSIGLGSSIWGLFESEDGDRFWAVAEVTATYESTCERTIDAQMIIDRDTRIECEPACHFAYAHHPETDQPASEARAAFDAARGASDA